MGHDVFISHSHEDHAVASAICSLLETRRIRCWMAPRDISPGSDFGAAIKGAISQSRVFVLIFSRASNISKHVLREVERAVHYELTIIPFRIEDTPYSDSLEYHLSTCHWLDAITPPIQSHIGVLARQVELLLQENPAREQAGTPADEITSDTLIRNAQTASTKSADLNANVEEAVRDPLFLEAARIVVDSGSCSSSLLQRTLKIGFSRVARLIDQLERAGICRAIRWV